MDTGRNRSARPSTHLIADLSSRTRYDLAASVYSQSAFSKENYPPSWNAQRFERDALCSPCEAIFCNKHAFLNLPIAEDDTSESGFRQDFKHHLVYSDMKHSAGRGCHLCSIFFASCKPGLPHDWASRSYTVSLTAYQWMNIPLRTLTITDDLSHTEVELPIKENDKADDTPHSSLSYATTASDEAFLLASDWLSKCFGSHKACRNASQSSSVRPSRILEILTLGRSISLRLKSTAWLFPDYEYVTLSHCWGHSKPLQLTSLKLHEYCQRVPIENLPRTFLDAVVIAARLGFKYLWIDTLCIIQDSPEDWSHEAKLMGPVYGNSVLTVAALAAVDDNAGCFVQRDHLQFRPCCVVETTEKRYEVGVIPSDNRIGREQYRSQEPLLGRGWALQERVLGPRTLFFGGQQMSWECRECHASESHPRLEPHNYDAAHYSESASVRKIFCDLLQLGDSVDSFTWHDNWWRIVNEYTNCSLTFATDRWVALAGLSQAVQQASGLTMIAGLWERHILRELCWEADHSAMRLMAPSWSWLSVDGPVVSNYNLARDKAAAAIISVPPVKDFQYPSGGMEASRIVVHAPMLQFNCERRMQSSRKRPDSYMMLLPPSAPLLSYCGIKHTVWFADVNFDHRKDFWALQITYQGNDKLTARNAFEYHGIVVTPNDPDGMSWSRIGFFYIYAEPLESYNPKLFDYRFLGESKTVALV